MKAGVKDRKMHVDFQDAKLYSQKWNRQDTPNYFCYKLPKLRPDSLRQNGMSHPTAYNN